MAFPSLQSGVQYDSKFPSIQKGGESIYAAMGQIVGQKLQDEQAKKAMYEQLLNIGLEDVKGKYQDEAAKIKGDLLKRTAQIFSEAEGLPNAEQLKEINAGKGKLTNYAKMYAGMEDWYKQASMQAASITDKKYREKTVGNITEIMSKPTLTETWDAILTKPWLEMPVDKIDIYKARKAILENADYDNTPFTATGKDKYGNIPYEAWKSRNPEQIRAGAEAYWNSNEEELKDMGFTDVVQFTEEFIGNEKVPTNQIVKPSKGGSGKDKQKTKVYYNDGTQAWEFSDLNSGKGIPIADFTPEGAKSSITDASITRVFVDPNTGELNAKVVAPSMTSMSLDDVKAKYGEKLANQMILLKPELLAGKSSKDPLNLTDFYVPYYMVSSFTDRYIDLRPQGENSGSNPAGLEF